MAHHVGLIDIVHASALHPCIRKNESGGLDYIDANAKTRGKAKYGPDIPGNFGLI